MAARTRGNSGRRNRGTFGGSASLFPNCDRTPVQKLERAERWIDDATEWYADAVATDDREAQRKARRRLSQLNGVAESLRLAIATGREWTEYGLLEVAA